jgi:predicted MFS family arabinose efflux permease
MFAILMASTNVGQGVGVALAGVLADNIGFRWTFLAITALNLAALPLMPLVFGRRKPRTAPET